MGSGIAHTFALGGYKVNLVDTDDELVIKSLSTIKSNLQRQVTKNVVTSDEAKTAVKNIAPETPLEAKIIDLLNKEPFHVDELCREFKLSIQEINATMALMELKGLVYQVTPMTYQCL